MVNSLGVTHLERRWSLVHYPVFCLFCTLSSYAVTFLLFIPPNLTFFLPFSVSPLVKRLDGPDVSLSLWPLLGLCSFPSHCLGKNPTNLMLALEPALSPFLTLSSSHRNSIVSPLPSDLISPHPYKVSLSSFFTKLSWCPERYRCHILFKVRDVASLQNTDAKQEKSVLLFRANTWWKWAVWDRIWRHLSLSYC